MSSNQNQNRDDGYLNGFVLNGWQVKPLAGLLIKDGHETHLEPKVMDVLVCLARHHGEVITRDMLHMINQVESRLEQLRELGWNTIAMARVDLVTRFLKNDYQGSFAALEKLIDTGVQPFGELLLSPLYDSFLERLNQDVNQRVISHRYREIVAVCDGIGLAKLGL